MPFHPPWCTWGWPFQFMFFITQIRGNRHRKGVKESQRGCPQSPSEEPGTVLNTLPWFINPQSHPGAGRLHVPRSTAAPQRTGLTGYTHHCQPRHGKSQRLRGRESQEILPQGILRKRQRHCAPGGGEGAQVVNPTGQWEEATGGIPNGRKGRGWPASMSKAVLCYFDPLSVKWSFYHKTEKVSWTSLSA